MTISTENRVAGPYAGAGTTPTYSFAFKVFAVSDLVVTKTVASVDTTLVYGSDYSVSLNPDQDANPGGTVTYCVSGTPTNLPAGTNLTITTAIPYTQGTQLTNGGGWYPKVVEYALDRLVAIVQQLKSIADRTLRLPITVTGVSTSLPVPSAGKLIGWDSLGTSIENKDPSSIAAGVIYGTGKADIFSGTGAQTAFTLSANPGAQANLDIAISGVTQRPGIDFTWTTGTTLTFTSPPPAGTNNILARYVQAIPTTGALQISANLSDVQDKPTALANLGVTFGTAANNAVKLDASARLPAVDASQTTNRFPRGFIDGLTLSYSSATTIGIAAGKCRSGADDADITLGAFTKVIQAAGAYSAGSGGNGLFTGARANSTWYHAFVGLYSGTPDIGFDTSVTAANKPGTFTNVRRIGSVRTDGSGNILSFRQYGDYFEWDAMPSSADVNATNPYNAGAAVLRTLTVPTGLKVEAHFSFSSYNGGTNHQVLVTDPDRTDTAPSGSQFSWNVTSVGAASISGRHAAWTDTSGRVRTRATATNASDTLVMNAIGWRDLRGKDA